MRAQSASTCSAIHTHTHTHIYIPTGYTYLHSGAKTAARQELHFVVGHAFLEHVHGLRQRVRVRVRVRVGIRVKLGLGLGLGSN